jgi:hypothetical protein
MDLGERYCIICDRENIESIQKLLFSWGYKWNGQSSLKVNELLSHKMFTSNKKIYLSNYSNGMNGWTLKYKFVHDSEFEDIQDNENINVYTDLILLRKQKLLKLKKS